MLYKPSSLITVRKKGSADISEYPFENASSKGIPHPVLVVYGIKKDPLLAQAVQDFNKGAYILWIENTIVEAQGTYDYFCRYASSKDVGLLHSRSTAHDRKIKEEEWTKRFGKKITPSERKTHPGILVSTQVCEQSLDIDADALYTSVCPMDMLLQRIGRTWRHRDFDVVRSMPFPKICWFGLENYSEQDTLDRIDTISCKEDLKKIKKEWRSLYIYDTYVIARTIEALCTKSSFNIPGDIREMMERTYA